MALYRCIVYDFLQMDEEPDYSIIYVSLQLFTTPTIAAYLVIEHHLLSTLIETLFEYFSQALYRPEMVRVADAAVVRAHSPANYDRAVGRCDGLTGSASRVRGSTSTTHTSPTTASGTATYSTTSATSCPSAECRRTWCNMPNT